eukprot:CAMPEP_0183718128 /NCGR_PEP_ID=MMETSP0737-20130205/11469_1 /TAXON_ID=385413 /ORGANISM="Thalassiosira miniscula, Strain CCMP1093" /LENGTH=330 /DNA_ID=CAMNT_0025947625 /DNA_START=43 /DNA_END=1035 /DNA_ORIENTATION=-
MDPHAHDKDNEKLFEQPSSSASASAPASALPDDEGDVGRGQDEVSASASSMSSSGLREYIQGKQKREIAKDVAKATAKSSFKLAKELHKELTTKRKDGVLPKTVSDLLRQIKANREETIERMVVVRTPVQSYVGKLMQVVSLGKYNDVLSESSYDQMFHLSLLINGRYVLQKNEVISLSDSGGPSHIGKESGVMAVKIPPSGALKYTVLLDRTKKHMGPSDFTNYCAKTNNCQDFILAILESNGLAYPHLLSFIKQDSKTIFDQLPSHTKVVARALTDVAAVGNKVVEDIYIKRQETDLKKTIRLNGQSAVKMTGMIADEISNSSKLKPK